jgi:hypothetical protein
MVLPVPGTSSSNTCPRRSNETTANSTTGRLPIITFSMLPIRFWIVSLNFHVIRKKIDIGILTNMPDNYMSGTFQTVNNFRRS